MNLERYSFTGHETFPFRYTWMKKAVDHVGKDAKLFGREDAMVDLGVGKNMVASIHHWALVCGVIEEDPTVVNNRGREVRVTPIGKKLFGAAGWDPYLEDPATLWVLHWQIASIPDNATTWYWVFNQLAQLEFTRDELHQQLLQVANEQGARGTAASLKRDVDCFIRTYVTGRVGRLVPLEDTLDCPLVDLGLLRELESQHAYVRNRDDHQGLPAEIFAWALAEFVRRTSPDTKTISLDRIAYSPGSPGRTYSLSDDGLLRRLEALNRVTEGALTFDDTAGLRQVLVRRLPDEHDLLEVYYRNRKKRPAGES